MTLAGNITEVGRGGGGAGGSRGEQGGGYLDLCDGVCTIKGGGGGSWLGGPI